MAAFPSAEEARSLSKVPAKMRQLGDLIRDAATIGETEVTVNQVAPDRVVELIEGYGYSVYVDLNNGTTTISWSE